MSYLTHGSHRFMTQDVMEFPYHIDPATKLSSNPQYKGHFFSIAPTYRTIKSATQEQQQRGEFSEEVLFKVTCYKADQLIPSELRKKKEISRDALSAMQLQPVGLADPVAVLLDKNGTWRFQSTLPFFSEGELQVTVRNETYQIEKVERRASMVFDVGSEDSDDDKTDFDYQK